MSISVTSSGMVVNGTAMRQRAIEHTTQNLDRMV